jgi:hypothetical protein
VIEPAERGGPAMNRFCVTFFMLAALLAVSSLSYGD